LSSIKAAKIVLVTWKVREGGKEGGRKRRREGLKEGIKEGGSEGGREGGALLVGCRSIVDTCFLLSS